RRAAAALGERPGSVRAGCERNPGARPAAAARRGRGGAPCHRARKNRARPRHPGKGARRGVDSAARCSLWRPAAASRARGARRRSPGALRAGRALATRARARRPALSGPRTTVRARRAVGQGAQLSRGQPVVRRGTRRASGSRAPRRAARPAGGSRAPLPPRRGAHLKKSGTDHVYGPRSHKELSTNMDRRRFLEITAVSTLSALAAQASRGADKDRVINDVSRLNPTKIAEERRPRSTDEVQAALRAWSGSVSVGGGRFSMGGQIAAVDSLHLDMRAMKQLVSFDAPHRRIRVQAGMTWRDLQDVIDPSDLSVKIMQSYSNFTVGGSVSVNCHGRYVGRGPLVNSVQALQLVTAEGEVHELSRSKDPELFRAVFGGYGGLGVIAEVELELEANAKIERVVQDVALDRYPAFFRERVLSNDRIVLHK